MEAVVRKTYTTTNDKKKKDYEHEREQRELYRRVLEGGKGRKTNIII